ncbi:competence protein ComEC [Tistlia consotensis]|uniref:Competence protein ComEC n=1 Tax=Tistlia consotensis USBA 355 TaxID=560819 RepID=A0A1Y6CQ48_9PROT|nr:ComEC/Rec2 family competence protein [Tistlia consotensis]SMF69931.1 competence protein ComEC [Tistlia consotensis USBA 355]SNS05065.1 competence protein ComEC [Tistlia consotensis]
MIPGFGRQIGALVQAARPQAALWLPVLLGAGIALYFALPLEPPRWLAPLVVGLLGLPLLLLWRRAWIGPLLLAALAAALGFQLAQLRSLAVAAPVLQQELGPVRLQATVERVERDGEGRRLWLGEARIGRLPGAATPERLRVSLRGLEPEVGPGDRIALLAILRPPPGPATPGAYDFARRAWFLRLGAVGFALGKLERLAPAAGGEPGLGARLTRWRDGLRQAIAERALAVLPDRRGAVAAALTVGERGAISEPDLAALRNSGLAHLLAISGLHLGLAAGAVFFALRAGLAAVPALALTRPIKKWAAAAALAAAFGYLQLAGASVTAQRAFVMVGLVLLAVLLDRTALTLRLVAWAAAAVLLLAPESLVSASFQLSFAAVVALVAAWELWRGWRERGRGLRALARGESLWLRPLGYLAALAFTSLIAGLATAPFAAYHFNRLALYGLVANLLAVPVAAFLVMPAALLALLAMPVGLDAPFLWLLGEGIRAILWVAGMVAGWPSAVALVPAMPGWGLAAVALGGLWLCLWKPPALRLLGLPLLLLGLASPWTRRPPDLLVAEDGRLVAVRGAGGGLALSSGRRARFVAEQWLRRAALDEGLDWPDAGASVPDWLRCDGYGCLYETRWGRIALPEDAMALLEDCRAARVIVTTLSVPRACGQGPPAPQLIVDRWRLWREGGQAIRLSAAGISVETTREARGERPWVRRSDRPRRPPWAAPEGAEDGDAEGD